ncbi:TraK family protein [Lonsdalea quercina]|uniref:TraK family protein n=1 Tax=Lonsdalea quercina TaxID=71657 RepID=UPI0039760954
MAKDYLTDLQEWVKQKKGLNGNSANSARVVFLAIREDVKNAIEAGYSLTTIWEHMHETGRVTTTYETFRRHVRRYIDERKRAVAVSEAASKKKCLRAEPSPKKESVIPDAPSVEKDPSTNPGSQLPTFNFNPGKKKGTK